MNSIDAVPALVKRLYETVGELQSLFPDRKFTPDGHLVGSLGEVIAAYRYGLLLLPASTVCHDAQTQNGTLVQIKATQVSQVALRSEPCHLIVFRLHQDGTTEEVYNGPGSEPWRMAGPMQRNGQRTLALSKLRLLMKSVHESQGLVSKAD